MPCAVARVQRQIGAQASLLDHRLTQYEVDVALQRLLPQVVVKAERSTSGPLRGFAEITERARTYPGRPAATTHAVTQLSSGSTGPSKIIGRDAANLIEEVKRYTMIDGVPGSGERIVSLASMVHVLGLVDGLLYGLHAGVNLTIPARMTADDIFSTVAAGSRPTTLLGVPFHIESISSCWHRFHIELLASVRHPPKLPQPTGKRPRRLHVVEQLPRTPPESVSATTPFSPASGRAGRRLQPPPQPVRTPAARLSCRTTLRKESPTMIDEIRQFVLDSLTDMNYSIDGVDDDTVLGPAGADLESVALAELAVRVEDHFGVKFDDDEAEMLVGMTVGEFCRAVLTRIQPASAH